MSGHISEKDPIRYGLVDGWLGKALVAAGPRGLRAVLLGDDAAGLLADLQRRFPGCALREDPAGELGGFLAKVAAALSAPWQVSDLPLDARGTEFQQRVWAELRRIPSGGTIPYGELARRVDRPDAVRAVAGACGTNPLAVIIPCHRVVGRDGSLGGYRWGLERKRALLNREKEHLREA